MALHYRLRKAVAMKDAVETLLYAVQFIPHPRSVVAIVGPWARAHGAVANWSRWLISAFSTYS